ncbi:MAG: hypothetical protein L3J30_15065, partial [Marinosulfonomonas sp.]|nr:hypothetical protein [Marinosulfonomonas sp.]
CLLLLDHPNNLRFGKTALSHLSAPSKVGQTLHQGEGTSGGQVTTGPEWLDQNIFETIEEAQK